MKCKHCGNNISTDSTFCEYCGNKIEQEEKKNIVLFGKIIISIILIGICIIVLMQPKGTTQETKQNIQGNNKTENTNIQKSEDRIIKQTSMGKSTLYLKVDSKYMYYLEYNGEKIYSVTEAKGTSNANSKDTFLEIYDPEYGTVIGWSGSFYALIDNKIQRLQ